MARKTDKVTTICYGTRREWPSRTSAIAFFKTGIACSEGSERDRYIDIVLALEAGETIASDGIPERKSAKKRKATTKDREKMQELKTAATFYGKELDDVREIIAEKRKAFESSIADLLAREDELADKWQKMQTGMIEMERAVNFS